MGVVGGSAEATRGDGVTREKKGRERERESVLGVSVEGRRGRRLGCWAGWTKKNGSRRRRGVGRPKERIRAEPKRRRERGPTIEKIKFKPGI